MTRAKKLLFLYQQLQPPSYSNIGTYEWNGEEELPPQFVLTQSSPENALKKALGEDGKCYYYNDSTRVYGNGSIRLHESIVVPSTGITEVSATFDILSVANTGTNPICNVNAFINKTREYNFKITSTAYSGTGLTELPPLTLGEHTLKIIVYHALNSCDIYIDNVKYATLGQYSATMPAITSCHCGIWSAGFEKVKLKAFKYSHTE